MSAKQEKLSNEGVDKEILQKIGFVLRATRKAKQVVLSSFHVRSSKKNIERLLPVENRFIQRSVKVEDLVMDDMICNVGYVHSVILRDGVILVTINLGCKGKRLFTKEYLPGRVVSIFPRHEYPRQPKGQIVFSEDPAFQEELQSYQDFYNATFNIPAEFWEKWRDRMKVDPKVAHLLD